MASRRRRSYQLIVADADGENPRVVLESTHPLMSPAWSTDGQWLAYVSFEGKSRRCYVQRVRTGSASKVSARAGINGAPAWSPDGRKLAVTLGGSGGNPDIYVSISPRRHSVQLTDDPAIDTEPAWAPDGGSIYFTSDRAGGPQIYRVGVQQGDRPKRITFTGRYNARPRVSPGWHSARDGDARWQQLPHRRAGSGERLRSGCSRSGKLDESPSFAPNGAMLIYSGQERGRGVLATVSSMA